MQDVGLIAGQDIAAIADELRQQPPTPAQGLLLRLLDEQRATVIEMYRKKLLQALGVHEEMSAGHKDKLLDKAFIEQLRDMVAQGDADKPVRVLSRIWDRLALDPPLGLGMLDVDAWLNARWNQLLGRVTEALGRALPCAPRVSVFLGQTRGGHMLDKARRMQAEGVGEIVQPDELPPRRFPWVFDNAAFQDWRAGRDFNHARYVKAIQRIRADVAAGRYPPPAWIVLPDRPGAGRGSLDFSLRYLDGPDGEGYPGPLYFVLQNGMEEADILPLVPRLAGLFVGGTQDWKNQTLRRWVDFAHAHGLKLHVGRGANKTTLRLALLAGADSIDSSLPIRSQENMDRFLATLCEHPDQNHTIVTPTTRRAWHNVQSWLRHWHELDRSKASAGRYRQLNEHFHALLNHRGAIEREVEVEALEALQDLTRKRGAGGLARPVGGRAAADVARLKDLVHNRLAVLRRAHALADQTARAEMLRLGWLSPAARTGFYRRHYLSALGALEQRLEDRRSRRAAASGAQRSSPAAPAS